MICTEEKVEEDEMEVTEWMSLSLLSVFEFTSKSITFGLLFLVF